MFSSHTLGVDLAAKAAGTAACLVFWGTGAAFVENRPRPEPTPPSGEGGNRRHRLKPGRPAQMDREWNIAGAPVPESSSFPSLSGSRLRGAWPSELVARSSPKQQRGI